MPRRFRSVGSLITARIVRTPLFRAAAVALALAVVLGSRAGARPAPPIPVRAASSPNLITVCVNGDIWVDGGFEATDSTTLVNPNYPVVFSTHFPTGHPAGTPPSGTPLCNVLNTDCTNGSNALLTPRTGNSWAWFGGNNENDGAVEIAYAEQTITFPSGASSATLNFYLRIGFVTSPFTDTLEVQVDGVTQQTYLEPPVAETSYTLRSIDLTAFADGAAHNVRFSYTQAAPADNNKANFDVDDATLDIVCLIPTETPTPTFTPTPTPTPTATNTSTPTPTATNTPTQTPTPAIPSAAPMSVDGHGSGATSNLNGVLESGETVVVAPAWANTTTVTLTFSGTASNLVGPAGPSYSIADSSADYGTVSPAAITDCYNATPAHDCYLMTVSGARPVAHWDATFDESLSLSHLKSWTLHVGESFADVPTSQQFYAFIENIFHNGITGGCGAGNYCPDSSVTRAQMAVFILKAKHGAGYTPPPCLGIFTDVECLPTPAFAVDWIEQLYNEGITGGCGPSIYCPNNAVTRAQMAVFLLKAKYTSGYVPPACIGIFSDVECLPTPAFAVDWIEQLYTDGITGGCGPGIYCPNNPNTRGQMAVFLTKTFGLLLYGP